MFWLLGSAIVSALGSLMALREMLRPDNQPRRVGRFLVGSVLAVGGLSSVPAYILYIRLL